MMQASGMVKAALGPTRLQAVDRACGDLRRGLSVLVRKGPDAAFVLAAERAGEAALQALAALGPLQVLLTHARAQTLKIRLYTPGAVAVPLARPDLRAVRHLADPTADLDHPLGGPFHAAREAIPKPALAALALVKRAELLPAAVVTVGDGDRFVPLAAELGLLVLAADDVMTAAVAAASAVTPIAHANVPLAGAEKTEIVAFRPDDGGPEELAIIVGDPDPGSPVLVRLHSACFTGDLLGSLRCDCGDQLKSAVAAMSAAGGGVLLYLAQEGRGIGLLNKLRAYGLQEQGFDTHEANERLGFAADERMFETAALMLRALGISRVRLMTNNPDKLATLGKLGIEVVERVPLVIPPNPFNRRYLEDKAKAGHQL